jgi:hypothetical protein
MIDALQGMKPRFLCFSRICKTGMKEREKRWSKKKARPHSNLVKNSSLTRVQPLMISSPTSLQLYVQLNM